MTEILSVIFTAKQDHDIQELRDMVNTAASTYRAEIGIMRINDGSEVWVLFIGRKPSVTDLHTFLEG